MRVRTKRPSKPRRLSPPRGWHNYALALLCLFVIVAAVTSIGSSEASSATEQRTATVGRGVVQSTVSGNGSLEAARQVELDFGSSGEVTEIDVEAGQKVSRGQVLARIDSSSARASLASAEAQLYEAEETLESALEGEEVSTSNEGAATTVLASYEPDSAVTNGEEAATGRDEEPSPAPKSPKSETEPSEQGEPSEPSQSQPVEAAPSEPESSSPAAATVSVATAEAKLRQARLSVESARQGVSETALRAPMGGTVASVTGSVGETVSGEGSAASSASGAETGGGGIGGLGATGGSSTESSGSSSSSAFIVLSQLGHLKMEVSFSESDIGKVKAGQPATVSISSMEGTELAGRVTNVDVLPSEGSSGGVVEYPATITLTQSAKGVRAGMSASAEVIVEQVEGAITVANEAISSGPGGETVTVLDGGSEAGRDVSTGLKGDETTEVISGVKTGETVVLPEASAVSGGGLSGDETGPGSLPGGGSLPSFSGGGPPSGFPGAP